MSSSAEPIVMVCVAILCLLPKKTDAQFVEWCIADEQTSNEDLQMALGWPCCKGGADCSSIQPNKPCYYPNTLIDHASFAFNSYYQKFKSKGAICYFNSAAIITDLDPSHETCKFEYLH